MLDCMIIQTDDIEPVVYDWTPPTTG